jgi:Ser/Thr protein kinase RdoA (MazF antagonist)
MKIEDILKDILNQYGFKISDVSISAFGTGLINRTWLVTDEKSSKQFILQRINHAVFKSPEAIAENISLIDAFIKKNYPDYLFEAPLKTIEGQDMVKANDEYFRLYRFVEGSHTVDVVQDSKQAYEAAKQFGKFTANLTNFDVNLLKITLPDFHNLPLRFEQFKMSLKNGNPQRIKQCKKTIQKLLDYGYIAEEATKITKMPIRVIHHDAKISNVLFDRENKGMCLIDFDTIMPGYYISDIGDMMRTYLSPICEEENDGTKHEIRMDFFEAIVSGYMSEMGNVLTSLEKSYFVYSGSFMIYMQALRFITDYLNNDVYYGAKYETHNLVRGENQLALLQRYADKEKIMQSIVTRSF